MTQESVPATEAEKKEVRAGLMRLLDIFAVREEMYLPILLMLGNNIPAMLELMVYMRDNNPTEHEIIQYAIRIHDGMIAAGLAPASTVSPWRYGPPKSPDSEEPAS